jgi:YD repeat-containing protein
VWDGVTSKLASRSEFLYDEPTRLTDSYGSLPAGFLGWAAPTVPARGKLTTARVWLDTLGDPQNAQAYLETRTQYDRFGNVVKVWDARGNTSEVGFSADFKYVPTSTISADPDGGGPLTPLSTLSAFDFATGVLLSSTDANGRTTSAEYEGVLDRLKRIRRPDGGWTEYGYGDDPGNLFLQTKTLRELGAADAIGELPIL